MHKIAFMVCEVRPECREGGTSSSGDTEFEVGLFDEESAVLLEANCCG